MIVPAKQKLRRTQEHEVFPAILIAAEDGVRQSLVRDLTMYGYIVLGAKNEAEALRVVITHSRPIHILLADVNMNGYELAKLLEPYRPEMRTVFFTSHPKSFSNAVDTKAAVAKVRELIAAPARAIRPAARAWSVGNKLLA